VFNFMLARYTTDKNIQPNARRNNRSHIHTSQHYRMSHIPGFPQSHTPIRAHGLIYYNYNQTILNHNKRSTKHPNIPSLHFTHLYIHTSAFPHHHISTSTRLHISTILFQQSHIHKSLHTHNTTCEHYDYTALQHHHITTTLNYIKLNHI
jgi:hypothetical protein